MSIQNRGALKWSNHNEKNHRYADGHWAATYYKLQRITDGKWLAWFFNQDGKFEKLGQGNFTQARGYAISHHHVQKSTPF